MTIGLSERAGAQGGVRAGMLRVLSLFVLVALGACSALPPHRVEPTSPDSGSISGPSSSGGTGAPDGSASEVFSKGARRPSPNPQPPRIPNFPWPPPQASASERIPDKWLRSGSRTALGDVANKIQQALRLAGHREGSYYAVPGGFAYATALEQIHQDGSPLPERHRWEIGVPPTNLLSLSDFVAALVGAPAGQYRAIVFVVTDASWHAAGGPPSNDEIRSWSSGGANSLPSEIGRVAFGTQYQCRVLIYEFSKVVDKPAKQTLPSRLSGQIHLERGGLWRPLSIL